MTATFSIKPLRNGGITLSILSGGEPAAFVYTQPDDTEPACINLIDVMEKLFGISGKPTPYYTVKGFSEPVKIRRRGDTIVIQVGRRKGYDGQLEDFSMAYPDFFREVCAGIRYGLNLVLAENPAGDAPDWVVRVGNRYNAVAARIGTRPYTHAALTDGGSVGESGGSI